METNRCHRGFEGRAGRVIAIASLTVLMLLVSSRAHAQNSPPALTLVPEHLFLVRGASFRQADVFAIEPSGLFVLGHVRRPVVGVARAVVGVGGSGGGVGLAMNLFRPCWNDQECLQGDDFFAGPFLSLEGRVEQMYGQGTVRSHGLTGWRNATYAGPQLTLSVFVLKASLGWMANVNQRSDNHVQFGLGAGF